MNYDFAFERVTREYEILHLLFSPSPSWPPALQLLLKS